MTNRFLLEQIGRKHQPGESSPDNLKAAAHILFF